MTRDRRFWIACALGGTLVVTGCLLPTIEIGQAAFIGAGDDQRGFDYAETIRFATYGEPGALLFLLGGAGLILLAAGAWRRPSQPLLIVAAAVLSVGFVAETIRIGDELHWVDSGLSACDEPLEQCVPFIAAATRELQAEIRKRPEARDPEFELLAVNGYNARGESGWQLILWASVVLAGVTLFRAFLLVLRPVWAGAAVAACGLLTLAYLFVEALSRLE